MSGAGGSDLHLPRSLSSDKAAREKCLKAWDRLRKEYQRVVIQMRRADLQPSVLVHGLQSLRQVTFPIQLQYAAYISEQKSLVSVDCAGTLRLHDKDGRVFGTRHLKYPVAGLLYACQVQQYVAWNHQELLLFDESFMFLSRIPVMQDVFSCVYHPGRNLVFSAGYGGVISWSFGQSRRSLVRHQSLNQGMMAEDKVTVLTIDTKSHTCYAACGTSVWEYDVSDGTLRRVRRHLHNRGISSLLYAEYLHLLISGSRDGSIKVWGCAAQLLAVYVGHTGPVTALSLTSSGVVLVSGSGDATLRTWDLTTKEQMEEQRVSGPLLGLEAFCSHGDCILSYCSHELCVWQVQHLYQLHCLLGTAVTKIIVSEERIPSRALCVCADATMRLISPSTGELITTLDGEEQLLGAEYCALQGTVYALLGDGHLIKASALTNPMRGISRVQVSSTQRLPCCFSLFSCIVDKEEAVGEQQHDEAPKEKEPLFNRTKHRFFCIIGFDDGSLQVYDWSSNQLQGETEAHSPGQVTCLMSNPENHHIISAGSDLTVKVWRFFPYSKESLNLCMSFPCAQQVGHMCSLNSQLFVAFHDSSSATYELVQYCLKTGTRSDHPSSDDHQDQITGLCASPGLGLVASCGKDRMIRIWTEENRLLRILCLNALPESLSFCSSEGRLLVGIHGHVYHISLLNLLPQPYKLQILCMASPPAAPDPPVSDLFSRGLLPTRNSEDCFLIKSRDYMKKVGQREEEFLILSTRDRELRLIQMGELRSSKRTKSDKKIRREAMEKYLQLFYQEKSSYSIPEQDDFDPEELLVPSGVQEPKKLSFTPLENNRGFFTDSALGFSIDSIPKHLQTSVLAAGFVPNSALLQFLWPMKLGDDLRPLKRRNQQQSKCIRAVESSERILQVKKEKINNETEDTTGEIPDETDDRDKIPSLLQDIITAVTAKQVSAPAPETSSAPPQSPAQIHTQKTSESRIPRLHPIQAKKPAVSVHLPPPPPPLSLLPDILDKPWATPSATCKEEELPMESTGSAEVPEIPAFILQFQEQSWFSVVVPGVEAQYSEFESRLLSAFLQAEQPMCSHLLCALQTLHQQGHLKNPQRVFHTLREAINRGANLKVFQEPDFLWLCLRFMNDLSRESRELMVEVLVTCVQTPAPHRGRFIALLHEFGVHDPHGFLDQKCNSWDSWDETGNSREALKKICKDWLHLWTIRLMDELHAATTWNKEAGASRTGRDMACQSVRGRGGNRRRHKELRECLPSEVTPVNVLNYYCDVQMKRDKQGLLDYKAGHGSAVLSLPPIDSGRALLRLGETGTHGKQRDQASGSRPAVQPLLRSNIIPFINLPVKKVTLGPFISTGASAAKPHLAGSLRQDVHRYFIVRQSYIERYY